MFTFGRQIRRMGFFRGCKISEPLRLSANRNAGSPFVLEKYHADKTGFIAPIWFSDVLRVSRGVYYAKVLQTVVVLIAVYVVNKTFRPFAMRKQPSKPMGFVNFSAIAYSDVLCAKISRGVSRLNCFGNSFAPRQNPGIGVVAKNGAEMFGGHSFNAYSKTTGCQA